MLKFFSLQKRTYFTCLRTGIPMKITPRQDCKKNCVCLKTMCELDKISQEIRNLRKEQTLIIPNHYHYVSEKPMDVHFSDLFAVTRQNFEKAVTRYNTCKTEEDILQSLELFRNLRQNLEKESNDILFLHYEKEDEIRKTK